MDPPSDLISHTGSHDTEVVLGKKVVDIYASLRLLFSTDIHASDSSLVAIKPAEFTNSFLNALEMPSGKSPAAEKLKQLYSHKRNKGALSNNYLLRAADLPELSQTTMSYLINTNFLMR
mgnify:CR=1 FL=1